MADPIDVKVTVLLPGLPALSDADAKIGVLMPPVAKPPPLVRQKRLPAQPTDVPAGHVWAGTGDGLIPYTGIRPLPGDLIAIVGRPGRRYVTSPLAHEPMRWPTFIQGCRCRCAADVGIVLFSTTCQSTVNLIGLDLATGAVLQFFGMNELGAFGGIFNTAYQVVPVAIDPESPFDLWAVDDRRFWSTRRLDTQPTAVRGYFTLVRYALSGGEYAPIAYLDLVDPGRVGFVENDPPAMETNFLAVIDGLPLITMQNAPARYLSVSGTTITTRTLTQDGVDYSRGLRGPIVTVPDRPASARRRYVIGTDGTDFELIEFDTDDAVTRVLPLPDVLYPFHPIGYCNRILVLNGSVDE